MELDESVVDFLGDVSLYEIDVALDWVDFLSDAFVVGDVLLDELFESQLLPVLEQVIELPDDRKSAVDWLNILLKDFVEVFDAESKTLLTVSSLHFSLLDTNLDFASDVLVFDFQLVHRLQFLERLFDELLERSLQIT